MSLKINRRGECAVSWNMSKRFLPTISPQSSTTTALYPTYFFFNFTRSSFHGVFNTITITLGINATIKAGWSPL